MQVFTKSNFSLFHWVLFNQILIFNFFNLKFKLNLIKIPKGFRVKSQEIKGK